MPTSELNRDYEEAKPMREPNLLERVQKLVAICREHEEHITELRRRVGDLERVVGVERTDEPGRY